MGNLLADVDHVEERLVLQAIDEKRALWLTRHEESSPAVGGDPVGAAELSSAERADAGTGAKVEDGDRSTSLSLRLDTGKPVLADVGEASIGTQAQLVGELRRGQAKQLAPARDVVAAEGGLEPVKNDDRATVEW
jgi:hypothetical protein